MLNGGNLAAIWSSMRCSIGNLTEQVAYLTRLVTQTGFSLLSPLASIVIGLPTKSMALTNSSITTTGGPVTIGSDIVLSKNQTWQGLVYAGDGETILLDPKTKTSAFTTQVIGSSTNRMTRSADSRNISERNNTTGNKIYESIATNDVYTVNATGDKTYSASSVNDTYTITASKDKRYSASSVNDIYTITASKDKTYSASSINDTYTINASGNKIYSATSVNDTYTITASGNKTFTATSLTDTYTINTRVQTYTASASTSDTSSWTSPTINRTFTCDTFNFVINLAGVQYKLLPTMVQTDSGLKQSLVFLQM
jgi:hypothetical protein